jgi:hypothetical protein
LRPRSEPVAPVTGRGEEPRARRRAAPAGTHPQGALESSASFQEVDL